MKKILQVVDKDTGEELEKVEFDGGYSIIFNNKTDQGNLRKIRKLDNGKFGDKHWIKNYFYRPIAEKLIKKFKELYHINPYSILFIEETEWKPGATAKQPWVARIKITNNEFTSMTGYDYIMEFREFYTEKMQREQIIALVYHELMHIDTDGKLREHDVQDWNNLVATLGVDWHRLDTVAKQLNMFGGLKAIK